MRVEARNQPLGRVGDQQVGDDPSLQHELPDYTGVRDALEREPVRTGALDQEHVLEVGQRPLQQLYRVHASDVQLAPQVQLEQHEGVVLFQGLQPAAQDREFVTLDVDLDEIEPLQRVVRH